MTGLQNRSLDRGIAVLEVLARKGACSLADLHQESGLAKSTIRRLLGTLQDRRFVRRSLSDQKYRINIGLPSGVGAPVPPELSILVDVAMPVLIELTQQVQWPSDLHLMEATHMGIIDSTRPLSPYHLYRGLVNRRLNIFGSATGQACLAHMKAAEIDALIARTTGDKTWGMERFAINRATLESGLANVRSQGYGTRQAIYLGETVLDDGLSAIAIHVDTPDRTYGAISLLFPRPLMATTDFAASFLTPLQAAATQISQDLIRYDPRSGADRSA